MKERKVIKIDKWGKTDEGWVEKVEVKKGEKEWNIGKEEEEEGKEHEDQED